jgi:protein O-mannosyl-transferase
MRTTLSTKWLFKAVAACLFVFAAVVYWPGLSGDYVFDDAVNILENPFVRIERFSGWALWEAINAGTAGPLKRPVSMLSFAANHALFGIHPFSFKLVNLVVHLATGLAIFALFNALLAERVSQDRRLAQANVGALLKWLPLFSAGAWLLHPLNLTSVLYVVQRMNSLATLFVVLAVMRYAYMRSAQLRGTATRVWWSLMEVVLLIGFACLCKENGVLAIPLIGLVEVSFFRFSGLSAKFSRFAWLLAWGALIGPVLVGAILTWTGDAITARFANREFSLTERLLTQSHAMWLYVRWIFSPQLSELGLYHDDVLIVKTFWQLPTFFAVISWPLLAAFSLRQAVKGSWLGFGGAWFIWAHLLESTVLPLEMVHEHRNYLAMIGLLFGVAAAAAGAAARISAISPKIIGTVCLAIALTLGGITFVRALVWGDLTVLASVEVANHPQSARSWYQMGRIHFKRYKAGVEGENELARSSMERAAMLSATPSQALVALIRIGSDNGKVPSASYMKRLIAEIQNGPPIITNTNVLIDLARCQASGYCNVSIRDLHSLVERVAADTRMPARYRADMHIVRAQSALDENEGFEIALYHFDRALRLSPNEPQMWLNMAEYHIRIGDFVLARDLVNSAQKVDRWRSLGSRISAMRERINVVENAWRSL